MKPVGCTKVKGIPLARMAASPSSCHAPMSYSTRDLDWVKVFHDDLVADVNRFAELDVCPFLDKTRLQPGFVWDEHLLAAASDSAILVPVLSPRFFQSDYIFGQHVEVMFEGSAQLLRGRLEVRRQVNSSCNSRPPPRHTERSEIRVPQVPTTHPLSRERVIAPAEARAKELAAWAG
jgi:hypothetical protein